MGKMRSQKFGSSEVTRILVADPELELRFAGSIQCSFQVVRQRLKHQLSGNLEETPAFHGVATHSLNELGRRLDSKTRSTWAIYGLKSHQFPLDFAIFHFIPKDFRTSHAL